MKALPVKQASGNLDALVDAAIAGEEVVLTRDDRAAVKLVPIPSAGTGRPQFGSARGLIKMSDDFDAPLEDFDDYTR
jgi:antitoxin (DNA-binding transcriptional repressor) of toxin-antitoxin stability system